MVSRTCCLQMIIKSFLQQTIWLFFRDMFKGICIALVLGPPIVSAIIFIVQVGSFAVLFGCFFYLNLEFYAYCFGHVLPHLLYVLFQKGGPYLAIYLWAFMFVLSIVMMTVYPILIAPLFNKFTPVSICNSWYLLKFSLWPLMFDSYFIPGICYGMRPASRWWAQGENWKPCRIPQISVEEVVCCWWVHKVKP